MKKTLTLLILINITLLAKFQSIDYKEVQKLQNEQSAVIVDIRTPPEWRETGVVPDSKLLMFFDDKGGYDVNGWLKEFKKYVPNKNRPFILVCRTASRTKLLGDFLNSQGYKRVYHLKGGITFGYIMMGYKTINPKDINLIH
jgi:rhodanese-related sulfurtransferase